MTDLHTHILPGMDDGAPDVETALCLLARQIACGVNTVALTPHYDGSREALPAFLQRRALAWEALERALGDRPRPVLIPAAEVSYAPGMADWEQLEQLCYAGTRLLLVEPPMTPWNDELFHQLYALEVRRGITPMIAHAERYLSHQTPARIARLLDTGLPLQVNAASLFRFGQGRRAMELITKYRAIPASDCHNASTRPPNLDKAAALLKKKLGRSGEDILQYAGEFRQW